MLKPLYVELRGIHDYALSRSERLLPRWLEQGFRRVPSERLVAAISMAFSTSAPLSQYTAVWRQLFP